MNFFKYLSLTILVLSFTANSNTQCMATPKDIATDFIDLSNPTIVKDTLIQSANSMIKSNDYLERYAGLKMLKCIVYTTNQGFEDAEIACNHCYKSRHTNIQLAVLKLLDVLTNHKKAINSALKIATHIIMGKNLHVQKKAGLLLHQLIVDEKISHIPQDTFKAVSYVYYNADKNSASCHNSFVANKVIEELTTTTGNIITIIMKKIEAMSSEEGESSSESESDEKPENV